MPKCIEFNFETASSTISAKALKMLYFHFSYKAILLALENYNKVACQDIGGGRNRGASRLPREVLAASPAAAAPNYDDFLIKQREYRQTATTAVATKNCRQVNELKFSDEMNEFSLAEVLGRMKGNNEGGSGGGRWWEDGQPFGYFAAVVVLLLF